MESGLTLFRVSCQVILIFAVVLIMGTDVPASAAPALPGTEMALGRDDAPVTIIEYASLSCAHCAKFHEQTLTMLQ